MYFLEMSVKNVNSLTVSSVGKFQQKKFLSEISLQLIKSSKLIIIKIKPYEFVNYFYLRSI